MSAECHLLAGSLGNSCFSAKFVPPHPRRVLSHSLQQQTCYRLSLLPGCCRKHCPGEGFFNAYDCSFLTLAQQLHLLLTELIFYCHTVKRSQKIGPTSSNRAVGTCCVKKTKPSLCRLLPPSPSDPFSTFRHPELLRASS